MTMPETQIAAWRDIQEKLPKKRRAIFETIAEHVEGLTLFEIEEILGWGINCVSGRVTELHGARLVRDSGQRRINPKSGVAGIVWQMQPRFNYDGNGQSSFT